MATIKLLLQKSYKSGGGKILNPDETRLYCFLILDRKHIIKIKTEYTILPKEWDFSKQLKKGAGSIEFNKDLTDLKSDIYDKYKSILKEVPDMPFSQISRTLKDYGKIKEIPILKNDKDFFGYLKDYRMSLDGEASPGTIAKFVSIENSLKEFVKTTPGKKYNLLTFSMIDHSFKDTYCNFLHHQPARGRMKTRPEGSQDGVLLATESKYIADIKTFLRWAEERNFNKYTTYKEFSPITKANRKRKKQKNDIVTLTLPELKQFYTFDFSDRPSLDRVRDLFCFGAFTVQRWSDIVRFVKSQLNDNVWSFESFKTKKKIVIDLDGYFEPALDILKKYDYQLPKISPAKFNTYLKDAAAAAGITQQAKKMRYVGVNEILIVKPKNKFLTSHDARRTGISILLNEYNFPISHLMEITAHSDLKTFQVYINPDRQARRKAVSKTKRIDELLTVVKEKAV